MKIKSIFGAISFLTIASFVSAQEQKSTSSFKVTADVVSSYVWRGVTSTVQPNIQPTLAYTKGNFEIGAWGSTSFDNSYKEVDIYAAYTLGNFKIGLTDYDYNFASTGKRYFNYNNNKSNLTDHVIEGNITYLGTASLPLSISVNTMFYGNDKKNNDPTSDNAYSTYIELGYAFNYFSAFAGFTPADGYYGDGYTGYHGSNAKAGLVNLGISANKNLKITELYSLPLKVTFGLNPQKEDAYLVFGITF